MTKYKAIVTTAGAAKIAAATAGGAQLKITHMAVGDGNGTLPEPTPEQTQLINEQYRAALNALDIANASQNHIVAELIIPANVGGFWLREMGLFDESGELIAVGNMAESYKPKLEEGSGRTQTLRMVLVVSSINAIQIIAGGDTVLASRDFVEKAILEHEGSRNHPDATTTVKGFVMLSNATNSPSESKAVTPAALKQVSDAGLKKASNLSDLQNKEAARSNLALGTAATRNVGTASGELLAASEGDKRYLKLSGGSVTGKTSFHAGIDFGEQITRIEGGEDGANYLSNNLLLKSWQGVGFYNTCTSIGIKGISGFINVRFGSLQMAGRITADGQIIEAGKRVYSPNNPPTASDVGAVAKNGDTMTGKLHIQNDMDVDGMVSIGGSLGANSLSIAKEATIGGNANLNNGSLILNTRKKTATVSSAGSHRDKMTLGFWGNEERPNIVEFGDAVNWLMSLYRRKDNSVQMDVNGDINAKTLSTGLIYLANARLQGDGNIWGTRWNPNGGWLWDEIVAQLNTRATVDYVNNTFVRQMRLGANVKFGGGDGDVFPPSGYVVTGLGDFGASNGYGYAAPLQYLIGGNWITMGV
ncbi:phage tail protein [Serratia sp. JUb9]|uniref:phage tail protein n=1 Tax=Serratia sp. JUb9 TaxID=2724469 RepID=UPI00164D76F8|nr:phage tail protein [Serratia sp. JUb9]QNK31706.1 phage tail protein [Serratia sp. JUb9]